MPEVTIPQKQQVGVIDIGSSAIRMVVAELGPKTEIRRLENLQKTVALGKDVFTSGTISRTVTREAIAILKNYKALLDTYGIKTIHAIATSAVRDASNRDNFIDQVFVRTGIDVEVIEGPEQNRLELIAVEHALADKYDLQKKNCLIIEVGSGTTEIIVLHQGEVGLTRTLSLGTVRLPEQAVAGKTAPDILKRILKRTLQETAQFIHREYDLTQVDTMIALGGDMRLVSRQILQPVSEDFSILEKKAFLDFVAAISKISIEEITERFVISYGEAETLYAALLFYSNFLDKTKAEQIIVPMVSIRDGLLLELSQLFSGYKRTDVSKQVMSSARQLGRKYRYDEPHALCVASLALKLFDSLKPDHGLGTKERMLLEVSAILHDIGMYISSTTYHKHSSYLVDAEEIFGLRKSDKNIVSNVVRYHRRSHPQATHEPYMSLPRQDRVVVSKLAAILRAADALDKSRQQKIRNFTLERTEDSDALWVPEETGDISIERDALVKRGSLFLEVFGASLALKQGNPPKV